MIDRFEDVKKQLVELAVILNEFKSEAVQLRILDEILGRGSLDIRTDEEKVIRAAKPRVKLVPSARASESVSPGRKKKAPAGAGAPATLTQLLAGPFFDEPRTINDVIEHCKHNLARTFKANEFSGKLGRMVRSGDLERKKNEDQQYEYKKA